MPSLKDLRNRITSVKATRKITKAMQMVAAAKLRRAQEVATAARPYADRMDRMMANLGSRVTDKGASPLLVGTGRDQVHLLIVMTGERGLAGGFNTNISKLARIDAQQLLAKGKTVKMIMVGRKGAEAMRRGFRHEVPCYSSTPGSPASRPPSVELLSGAASVVDLGSFSPCFVGSFGWRSPSSASSGWPSWPGWPASGVEPSGSVESVIGCSFIRSARGSSWKAPAQCQPSAGSRDPGRG